MAPERERLSFDMTPVEIDYTNWRGERRLRRIMPVLGSLRFAESEWHKPAQWVFDGFDLDLGDMTAPRTFAMKDVHSWRPA